ncbi:MAG: pyruvate ferredoxin oxidoreductase subunit gamma [Candidatus Undinarchaeales archaeon]|jgi:pyruvate ferredoxin oxidoreductase gamma subunit|nr:pyruvate ferredoxin oxidoreductase subunit gamma [Candidatus Undinarchaeales archaeon]MDP7494183.1 pyruvate ferredoxin oxidoreductase subunit gamma [Candidatus Undinarchaeales archaeon]
MQEIRFHGRGGQGAVTAAQILAVAGFSDGGFTQSFPMFGVERRGAPVQAFVRIDKDEFIRTRTQVYDPDIVVVLDPTLLEVIDATAGLKKGGMIIINTERDPSDFGLDDFKVRTVNATKAAFDVLGRDIVNTAMLGAFAAFTGEVSKGALVEAIPEFFGGKIGEKNKQLVERVFDEAKERM